MLNFEGDCVHCIALHLFEYNWVEEKEGRMGGRGLIFILGYYRCVVHFYIVCIYIFFI